VSWHILIKLRGTDPKMQPNDDLKKRPLLTAEQLQTMRQAYRRVKKGTPREEFEKLFRRAPARQK
jgi:hypothetical protein